jgi:hypothetical protein
VCLCFADGCVGQDADLLVLSKEGLRVKYVIAKGQVRHKIDTLSSDYIWETVFR